MKLEMPVSGVFTSWATPAASKPIDAIFSEILQLLLQLNSGRDILDDDDGADRCVTGVVGLAQWDDSGVDDQRVVSLDAARVERDPRQRRTRRRITTGGTNRLDELAVEHILERATVRLVMRDAIQRRQSRVPSHHPVIQIDDEQAIVERLEDVLVEGTHPIDFERLYVELTIEPGVLECGRDLSGHCRKQRHILAAERLAAVLAAEREHRDRALLRDAWHEVVQAGVAPELDLFDGKTPDRGRVIERDVVAVNETAADSRALRQCRRMTVAKTRGPHRTVVRRHLVLEQQCHAIDEQRFDDA